MMRTTGLPFLRLATVAALGLALGACEVAQSSLTPVAPQYGTYGPVVKGPPPILGLPPACVSSLGSYALPKAYLKVTYPPADPKPGQAPDLSIGSVRHPDQAFVFCLDHLNSPLSGDTIQIVKWWDKAEESVDLAVADKGTPYLGDGNELSAKTPFLGAVLVNSTDYTVPIARALIYAAMTAATGKPMPFPKAGAVPGAQQYGADLEFDPFDPAEAAQSNARLKNLGYCVIVDGYTVVHERDHQAYCDAPTQRQNLGNPALKDYLAQEASPADPRAGGVMYRARLPYRVLVYRKKDPKGQGRWELTSMKVQEFENLSPVLALQIDRTAFGGKRAALLFDQGTLTNTCLSKTSEINGFVDIPVEAMKNALSIPANIFAVRIDSISNQMALMDKRKDLSEKRKALLQNKLENLTQQQVKDLPNPYTTSDATKILNDENAAKDAAALLTNYKAISAPKFSTLSSAFFSDTEVRKLCGSDLATFRDGASENPLAAKAVATEKLPQ